MTRPLSLIAIIFVALLPARAQAPANSAKTSSISGTVVKEPGSEPLKKVLVQIIAEIQGESYTASTDSDGHFRVENVAPNRYRIFIERTGFTGVNGRGAQSDVNVLTVQAGQTVEDLLFRMRPTAVISGRVSDEDGDPISGVRVIVQRKKPGKAAREGAGMAATNDLGEYRIAGLFPGQYWIVAMPPPDFRDYERQEQSATTPDQNDTRYVTTYYPGTYDALQATSVSVKAGDEIPVNLTLVPARTYRVRGTVTGLSPGQKPAVEMFSRGGDTMRVNASEIGPDGQFEIRGVAPGSYLLKMATVEDWQAATAHQDVNVVAADLDGIKLVPQPTFTLSGHFHIEGASVDVTQYSVNLRAAEVPDDMGFFMSPDFFGSNAPVDRQGNFSWKGLNSGSYIVQVVGGGSQPFFLKSATLGGHDVGAGFTVSGPVTLEVSVSTKSGTIEGTVTQKDKEGDADHPVSNATVVAVPEEKYRKIPDRFISGSTDQHGRFVVRGLAPGSYTLYAWQDVEDTVWRDPDFLKSQDPNGTSVKVEEGSSQKADLKLSAVPEEWR
jgi:protocatechuate 3,4-dioxygenase beta subunit